jgi:hypothetical protein
MRAHVCFGSFADIEPCPRDVRFAPESEHRVSMERAATSSAIRTSFSVIIGLCFRETGFCDPETAASSRSTDRQQRQSTRTKTHQFGAICTTLGNQLPTKRLSAASPEVGQRDDCGMSRDRPQRQALCLRKIGHDNGMLSKVIGRLLYVRKRQFVPMIPDFRL